MKLELEGVDVRLGRRRVLNRVTIAFEPARVTALVGPNGAGKTTLLRAAAALLKPESGRVQWDGHDPGSLTSRERARRVAFVPQESPLDYPFTVREVVAMGRYAHTGRFAGTDANALSGVRDALAQSHLVGFEDRLVTELSRGERQRVMLARALAQDAPALLLDEPTSNLDLGQAHHVHEVLRERARQGATVVTILHDLETGARVADELVLVANGRVLARGPPRDVLTPERVREAFGASVRTRWDEQDGLVLRVA